MYPSNFRKNFQLLVCTPASKKVGAPETRNAKKNFMRGEVEDDGGGA